MKKLLFVDGCLHRERSRTEKLAQAFLKVRLAAECADVEQVILEKAGLSVMTEERPNSVKESV